MLIILHVPQRMLQSTVKMIAYQLMLNVFKIATGVKECLNYILNQNFRFKLTQFDLWIVILKFELEKDCMRQCSRDFGVCSDDCPCYANCYNGCPCSYERQGAYKVT